MDVVPPPVTPSDLLVEGILKPLRNDRAVSYRPPGGDKRGRPGAIRFRRGNSPNWMSNRLNTSCE
jgi:hypothetical protein